MEGSGFLKLGDLLREKMDEFSDEAEKTVSQKDGKLVSEMDVDDYSRSVLKVTSKRMQTTRDGKHFLLLTLADRSGMIRGIDWHNAELNDKRLKIGTVARFDGKISLFDSKKQFNIRNSKNAVQILSTGEFDPKKFVEITSRDVRELYDNLIKLLDRINDDDIRGLLKEIFVKDERFAVAFLEAPAAVTVHHGYKGGLIEHSMDVAKLAEQMTANYPGMDINMDIVIAGSLLHDIGKVREYSIKPSGIERTSQGELIGHIVIGVNMLHEYAMKVKGFDSELLTELEHIILSHHGEVEWGAPVLPKTIEAMIIHGADNIDSKVAQFREWSEKTLEENGTNDKYHWSNYNKYLSRRIRVRGINNGEGVE